MVEDSVFITLRFADGSKTERSHTWPRAINLAKEYLEVYGDRKTFVLDDFKRASMIRNGKETTKRMGQDKGQADEIRAVCATVLGKQQAPIAIDDLAATTRATFRIRESLRTGQALNVL